MGDFRVLSRSGQSEPDAVPLTAAQKTEYFLKQTRTFNTQLSLLKLIVLSPHTAIQKLQYRKAKKCPGC